MAWDETVYAIDEIDRKLKDSLWKPRKAVSLTVKYNAASGDDPENITLTIGDSKPVYVDAYDNGTTTYSDRAELVRTAGFEIWRKVGSTISEYGETGSVKLGRVLKGETTTTYVDDVTELEDLDTYYAVFSVGENGAINKSDFQVNHANKHDVTFNVYGFKHNFLDTNPTTCITYPTTFLDPTNPNVTYNIINNSYTPMSNSMINGSISANGIFQFNVGNWSDFLSNKLHNIPYMVKSSDREADYKLSSTNYAIKSKDSTYSDYNNTSYLGGAFAWIAKLYTKEIYMKDANNHYRYVLYSQDPETKNYGFEPTGFINPNDQELEGIWIPIGYTMSGGKNNHNPSENGIVNQTTDQQYDEIKKLNSNAVFFGGPIINILRDLEYMMMKTTDIQSILSGRCQKNSNVVYSYLTNATGDWNSSDIGTGYSSKNVPFRVSVYAGSSGDYLFKLGSYYYNYLASYGFAGTPYTSDNFRNFPAWAFHSLVMGGYNTWIRDPYTLAVNGRIKVSKNYTYDLTGESYEDTGIVYSQNYSGYPFSMVHTSAGSLPAFDDITGGSSSLGLADRSNVTASRVRVAVRLGNAGNDIYDGPSRVGLDDEASYSNAPVGCATMLLPDPGYTPYDVA